MSAEASGGTIRSLSPALVQTFATILVGYMFGRFKVVDSRGLKAMSLFVSMLAYPSLVLWSLANLDLRLISWAFFGATLLARALVFIGTVIATLVVEGVTPTSVADAGIYAIFTTQSNDMAMGIPILDAVFAATHPEFSILLFVINPVKVILNPFGFYMMEWGRTRMKQQRLREERVGMHQNAAAGTIEDVPLPDEQLSIGKILMRVLLNPVIVCTFLGVILNLIFRGSLPNVIDNFFQALGNAFSATALFVLGVGMSGTLEQLNDRRQLKLPLVLFVGKSIIMPIVARLIMSAFTNDSALVLYAFIVGTLPCSPSVPFFAYEYEVPSQNIIAPAMVLGTFLACPIMLVSAQMVTISLRPESINSLLTNSLRLFCGFGLAAAIYFCVVLLYNSRYKSPRDKLLLSLLAWQFLLCFSSEFCGVKMSVTLEEIRYRLVFISRIATRVWITLMAINEIIQFDRPEWQSRCFLWYNVGGFTLITLVTLIVELAGTRTNPAWEFLACWRRFGFAHWTTSLFIVTCCMSIIIFCLYRLHQRKPAAPIKPVQYEEKYKTPIAANDIWAKPLDTSRERVFTSEQHAATATPEEKNDDVDVDVDEQEEQPLLQSQLGQRRNAASATTSTTVVIHPITPTNNNNNNSDDGPVFDSTSNFNKTVDTSSPRDSSGIPPHMHFSDVVSAAAQQEREESWLFGFIIFLYVTIFWMIILIILSIWSMSNADETSESHLEFLFLDGVMTGALAVWTWAIFSLPSSVISPLQPVANLMKRAVRAAANWFNH